MFLTAALVSALNCANTAGFNSSFLGFLIYDGLQRSVRMTGAALYCQRSIHALSQQFKVIAFNPNNKLVTLVDFKDITHLL